jgi:hypothetical protein
MADEFDMKKILGEYANITSDIEADDFGFSAVSEEEYNNAIKTEGEQTADQYKQKLKDVEKLIMPFLLKLIKTSDKEYVYWPNRKPAIEAQIKKILTLTRG